MTTTDDIAGGIIAKLRSLNITDVSSVDIGVHTGKVCRVTKTDEDRQLVFGWASVCSIGGREIIDKQGDIVPEDELENAVFDYNLYCRKQGDMHERLGVGRLVQSMVFTKEMSDVGLTAVDPTTGEQIIGWFVGFKVDDAAVWKRIKDGHLPEFSIGGRAIREDVEAA